MKKALFITLAILCILLAFVCISNAQSFPYTVVPVDVRNKGQQFVIDREFYGSTPFIQFDITDNGTPFNPAGWVFYLKYGYSRNADAMVSFCSTNFASITNNSIRFNGTTNFFFEPKNGYYVALHGVYTNGGYQATFAEGSMDVYYTPAGDPNVPSLQDAITFKIVSIDTFSAATNSIWVAIAGLSNRTDRIETRTNDWNTAYSWGNHAGLYLGLSAWSAASNALWGAISNRLETSVFTGWTNAQHSINTNHAARIEELENRPVTDTNLTVRVSALETNAVLRTDLDGGWYYPDWFAWSFAQEADGVPDVTTIMTNNDVVLQRNVYSAQGGSWDISYSGMKSPDFADPAVTSSSPSVATATVSKVWYVSSGTAQITATLGGFSRSTNLVMQLVSSMTNETAISCVTGSAACAFAAGIDSRLTDGTDKAVYSTQDHAATNYVRNPDSWVADIDLTCVSPWNSTGGRARAGTLIGSDCIIFANHYPIPVGASVRFITAANSVVERTLSASKQVAGTDLMIGRLSSSISTNDCRPALLLPSGQSGYMPWINSYGELRPGLMIDQYENAYAGNLASLTANSTWRESTNAVRAIYWKFPVVGDSGSPMMLIASNSLPIITGTFYSALGGPSVGYYNSEIRSAAAALGCDTGSIVDADFDALGFTNFNPGPPEL